MNISKVTVSDDLCLWLVYAILYGYELQTENKSPAIEFGVKLGHVKIH